MMIWLNLIVLKLQSFHLIFLVALSRFFKKYSLGYRHDIRAIQ